MSGYVVLFPFADAKDNGHVYRTGDTYPREGYQPDSLRVVELASTANALGPPLIEKIEEVPADENKPAQEETPVEETTAEDVTEVEETPAEETAEAEEIPAAEETPAKDEAEAKEEPVDEKAASSKRTNTKARKKA